MTPLLLNTRTSVLARLVKGPIGLHEIKSPATTRELIRLEASGDVKRYALGTKRHRVWWRLTWTVEK